MSHYSDTIAGEFAAATIYRNSPSQYLPGSNVLAGLIGLGEKIGTVIAPDLPGHGASHSNQAPGHYHMQF